MTLEQKMNDGIKNAMLAKDKLRLETLRAVKAAIILEKTAENATAPDEASDIKMLQKLVKQRRDAAEIYKTNNRIELAEKEQAEASIIEEYLPEQMSVEELTQVLKTIITNVGASSAKDMGKVMGEANKQLAGKADGKLIASTVKLLLA